MKSLDYCYWALGITSMYLIFLFMQKRYRLLLPSTIHTSIWIITILLIICQLNGFFVSKKLNDSVFYYSSRFICALMIASVIGFTIAHITTAHQEKILCVRLLDIRNVNTILRKFKWIPYTCGIVGSIILIYLIQVIGNIDSLNDYRIMAITTKKIGYAAIAQRISGHINILGSFYLMMLGYKYGQSELNIKEFLKYAILCSMINIVIGGRVWILTATLPFFTAFFFSRKYSFVDINTRKTDKKKYISIIIIFISLFSIIGALRSNGESMFFEKFLYLTDGSRMTNIVLEQFPEGTYNYEYGKSTLFQKFIESPMTKRFSDSISHDIGLSVTVKSIMPYLYYDFGFIGGAIFWGIICFVLEYTCIRLKYRLSVFSILLFCQLSEMLFQSPVGHIFNINMPVFEWLIILYFFRKRLFGDNISSKK